MKAVDIVAIIHFIVMIAFGVLSILFKEPLLLLYGLGSVVAM